MCTKHKNRVCAISSKNGQRYCSSEMLMPTPKHAIKQNGNLTQISLYFCRKSKNHCCNVQKDNVQQNNGLCCCSVVTKIYFRPGREALTSISVETLSQILIFCRKHRLDRPHNTQELWMVFTQWALSILSTNPSLLASITYESNLARSIKLKLILDGQAEPVPRVAIFFPARPKIWACARPPLMTD